MIFLVLRPDLEISRIFHETLCAFSKRTAVELRAAQVTLRVWRRDDRSCRFLVSIIEFFQRTLSNSEWDCGWSDLVTLPWLAAQVVNGTWMTWRWIDFVEFLLIRNFLWHEHDAFSLLRSFLDTNTTIFVIFWTRTRQLRRLRSSIRQIDWGRQARTRPSRSVSLDLIDCLQVRDFLLDSSSGLDGPGCCTVSKWLQVILALGFPSTAARLLDIWMAGNDFSSKRLAGSGFTPI